jgi:hypothetical protein
MQAFVSVRLVFSFPFIHYAVTAEMTRAIIALARLIDSSMWGGLIRD